MAEAIPTYPWFDQVPDHLKTRNQLAEQGLRPGGPVRGQVVWKRGKRWADLYSIHEAKPKKLPTAAQLAALKQADIAQRTCPRCKTVLPFRLPRRFRPEQDCPECYDQEIRSVRDQATRQAAIWLKSSRTVILDTETTDLDGFLVEIAIIKPNGEVLMDTRLNPRVSISEGAHRVHGISNEEVADAPGFEQIFEPLAELLRGRRVVTYNAPFDRGILFNEARRLIYQRAAVMEVQHRARWAHDQALRWVRSIRWRCAMELYARWYGDWSEHHGDFRWQPLTGGDHTALGDCRACLDTLQRVAKFTEEK